MKRFYIFDGNKTVDDFVGYESNNIVPKYLKHESQYDFARNSDRFKLLNECEISFVIKYIEELHNNSGYKLKVTYGVKIKRNNKFYLFDIITSKANLKDIIELYVDSILDRLVKLSILYYDFKDVREEFEAIFTDQYNFDECKKEYDSLSNLFSIAELELLQDSHWNNTLKYYEDYRNKNKA